MTSTPAQIPPKYIAMVLVLTLHMPLGAYADYMKDAQGYLAKGETNSAIIQLKNLLKEDSKNAQARLLLGKTYIKNKFYLAGIKELERARDLGIDAVEWRVPLTRGYLLTGQFDEVIKARDSNYNLSEVQQAELLAIIGHAYLGKNQIADARETFVRALSIGVNAYAKVGQARIEASEENFDQALKLIDQALSIEPKNIDALMAMGRVKSAQNNVEDALKSINQVLDIDARNEQARLMRAELLVRNGDWASAMADVQRVLRVNPNNAQANYILSRNHLDAKEYEAALLSGEKVLRVAPDHMPTYLILGVAHFAQKNYEQARYYLDKFITVYPANTLAARLLGASLLQSGEINSAIELMQRTDSSIEHQDAQLLNVLGRAYLQADNFEKGISTLNRAIEINPSNQATHIQIAIGQLASGALNDAVSKLETEIELSEGSEQTNVMLILSYARLKAFDKAISAIDTAIEKYPDNVRFYYLRGLAQQSLQNIGAARKSYSQSLEIQPEYIPSYLALAKLDINVGEYDAAKRNYDKALKVAPNHLQTLLLMGRLSEKEGDKKRSLRWILRAKDGNPSSIVPVTILVNYYIQNKELDKAHDEVNSFAATHDRDIATLSLLASVSMVRQEYDTARSYLLEIIAKNSMDINHRMQLVQIANTEKRYDEALLYIDEIQHINPNHAGALMSKANILMAKQNLAGAQESMDTFSALFPGTYINDQLQGDMLLTKGDSAGAIVAYNQAFRQAKTTYLLNALVREYVKLQEFTRAENALIEYLQVAPEDNSQRLRLATIYQQQSKNPQAIVEYERVALGIKDNHTVFNNLAWLYWLESSEKALNIAEKAYKLASDKPEVMDTYGWIMLHQGNKKQAQNILQTASSRAPSNPNIRYHLAKAMVDNGNSDQARKELTRLLRNYSSFSEKSAAIELLESLN